MRKSSLFSSIGSLEMLELKLSPVSFSVGALAAAAVSSPNPQAEHTDSAAKSDPLPNPEPPPGPDPGDNPPVVYPILPTSGPSGPGS